jgi:diguanylate cyclase (GGDEF)-like protein
VSAQTPDTEDLFDFRRKSTLGVVLIAFVFVAPFMINNFLQGRHSLGAWSGLVLLILAANAWSILRGRYNPSLTLFGLVPVMIVFLAMALSDQGIIGALWSYPAVISFYFMLTERKAWLANAVLLVIVLPQAWMAIEPALAARVTATLLTVSAFAAMFIRVITLQQRKLRALVVTDSLTGLLNRTLLNDMLEDAIQHANRSGVPMTLATLDLDHFKSINDTLGHDAGDTVLRGVGDLLRKRMRRVDKMFRPGGEEFLALLYGADGASGRRVAEELRAAIAAHAFLPDRTVTVSIGLATLQPGEQRKQWIKRSDENLYRAKAGGRNQVVA